MNNHTERTWMGPVMENELKKVMKAFIDYHPRKLQSEGIPAGLTSRHAGDLNGCGTNSRSMASMLR
jgi:hypothetical protein